MELPIYERKDRVPLPPMSAKVQTTACAYCAVGCGYKVYTWPVGVAVMMGGGPAWIYSCEAYTALDQFMAQQASVTNP